MNQYRIFSAFAALCVMILTGCGDAPSSGTGTKNTVPARYDGAKLEVCCGIAPAAWLVRMIGGDKVNVLSILPDGKNAHDYEPGIAEVRALRKSVVFFAFGLPFERRVVRVLGGGIPAVDLGAVCDRIPMEFDCGEDHDHDAHGDVHEGHKHGDEANDPHVWLGMDNLAKAAAKVAEVLIAHDPKDRGFFLENLAVFERRAAELRDRGRERLGKAENRNFYVHHPAFGYFAKEQHLKQRAVELGGKEPSPRHLSELIRRMRTEKIDTVFVQPSMNPATARTLGDNGRCRLVTVDPLGGDVFHTYERLTEALSPRRM